MQTYKIQHTKYDIRHTIYIVMLFLLTMPVFAFASATHGTIDDVYKYAWADKAGWINFGATHGGVAVTDDGLLGYAWSENFGWINLSLAGNGVKNNGEGVLSGYAWGDNTGWINFSGVVIDDLGKFSGTASGDITGTVNFNSAECPNCHVATDWRPKRVRGGALPPSVLSLPSTPASGFSILINNGQTYTNNPLVMLQLNAGADVKTMVISESPNFENAGQENYQVAKNYTLSQGDGQKTIYVKFYTQYGQPSQVVQSSIILKTQPPEIKITSVKNLYNADEEVVLSGITSANAEVSFYLDQRYGSFQADASGSWLITLGKMSSGAHKLEMTAHDLAGNNSQPLAVEFSVGATTVAQTPLPLLGRALEPILRQLENGVAPFVAQFFPRKQVPVAVVTVPKIPPMALSSKWNIFPTKPVQLFVLAPLPAEINVLAEKFPSVQKTFSEVGISKITDIEKLKNTKLNLPGLSQFIGLEPTEVAPGKFAPLAGIKIADLPAELKQQIPSDIAFTRVGGGLIDVSTGLSVNNQGSPSQTIETTSGASLEFIVKVDAPANKVTGYIVFTSRKPQTLSKNIPMNYLTASLSFAPPNFAKAQTKPVEVEEKMVLSKFEYHNTGNGVYTAMVQAPTVSGQYEIITVVDYKDIKVGSKELRLVTVVDPEGYVYEKKGDKETRIGGAVASLYWLNPSTKKYELWPAKTFQQDNPQVTDVSGTYSFLVPEGYYYLKVDAPGYLSYEGEPIQVKSGSGVHVNVELKTKYWFLQLIDWKTILLIAVVLLLLYNFYQDKRRQIAQ
ncbi:MAG: hypothetical protein NT155_03305 [Candidatus Staskawiczbacteria bacterium]|nr:hypothetical protein [Candidatus Staskawiczbacteria bacterium]